MSERFETKRCIMALYKYSSFAILFFKLDEFNADEVDVAMYTVVFIFLLLPYFISSYFYWLLLHEVHVQYAANRWSGKTGLTNLYLFISFLFKVRNTCSLFQKLALSYYERNFRDWDPCIYSTQSVSGGIQI